MWLYPDGSRILELSTKCAPSRGLPGRRRDAGVPRVSAGSTSAASSRPRPTRRSSSSRRSLLAAVGRARATADAGAFRGVPRRGGVRGGRGSGPALARRAAPTSTRARGAHLAAPARPSPRPDAEAAALGVCPARRSCAPQVAGEVRPIAAIARASSRPRDPRRRRTTTAGISGSGMPRARSPRSLRPERPGLCDGAAAPPRRSPDTGVHVLGARRCCIQTFVHAARSARPLHLEASRL